MVGLICLGPALDAVSVMLAKEAEDMRDRNRLLGLSFLLYRPGLGGALDGTPSESLTHLQSCRPRCRATHCTILGAISPCCAASLGPPSPLWGGGRAPKQHRPYKVTISPQLPQDKRPWPWSHGGFAAVATVCLSRGAQISRNHSDPGHGGENTKSSLSPAAASPTTPCRTGVLRGIGLQSHYSRHSFTCYYDSGKGLWPDPKGEALPNHEAREEGEREGR